MNKPLKLRNPSTRELVGKTACVTGGSGLIGRRIVECLLHKGYSVRVLSRNPQFSLPDMEVVQGSVEDLSALQTLLDPCDYLFHCAAELSSDSRIWAINVEGTKRVLDAASQAGIEYLCHLSSAGVVGRTAVRWIDETTPCNPQTLYERSKLEAERLISADCRGCRTIILRPTNVIDWNSPGLLSLPARASWMDRLLVFIKGGERAHLIHAIDVAAAAVRLIQLPVEKPECFFISYDDNPLGTFADVWSLYVALSNNRPLHEAKPKHHLPVMVPSLLRQLWRGSGNRGDVRYSAKKLLSTGFSFVFGLEGALRQIAVIKRGGNE